LIIGIIGDESRFDAATISDTVNTASRMEGLTKQYHAHIILSEPCLNTMPVNEGFHFRYLGKTRIKGKQAPTDIYECLSGYSPEAQEIKLRTLDFFTAGLCHYLHQDFEKAVQSLQEVVNANPEDKTAQLFLDRALQSSVSGIIEE
jgi:tetratricopeptide (TPR) repeat protein